MKITVFTLCQAANVDMNGNLNILGAFDDFSASKVPVVVSCMLAIKMRFEKIDEGDKALKLVFIDADGKDVLPRLEKRLPVKIPAGRCSAGLNLTIPLKNLKLDHFGNYALNMSVDGRLERSFDLTLHETPKKQPE